jgi:cytochrome P450
MKGGPMGDGMRHSDWDPLSEEAREHPDRVFAELRAKCPVAYSDAFGGFWSLSKYEDIELAAKDPATFSSEPRFIIPTPNTGGVRWKPLQSDPPEHLLYRGLLQPFFARGRIRLFEKRIRQLAVELIEASGRPAVADLCPTLTLPLTGGVLCMFLGFPESDWGRLKQWTAEQLRAGNAGDVESVQAVMQQMTEYIKELRAEREARPRPVERDLMSALLAASVEGDRIDDENLEGIFKLLMGAGHETTANGLGNLLRHLVEHPSDQDRLRDDPSLIPGAVEEVLRCWGPVAGLVRTTTREVEIRETTIPAGATVALLWSSAGRDEDLHTEADSCRLERENTRHLAFGAGAHRCIGAELARVQLRIATEELLARTRAIRPAGVPKRRGWPSVGTSSLPVAIDWLEDPVEPSH